MTKSGRKRPGRKVVRVKFGSAHVSIYQGSVRGHARFTVSFYQNGQRVRRTFDSLAKAREEARAVAMKIQQGLAEVADMRVADRQNYLAATSLLDNLSVPLVAAVEEYVRCRELLGGSPLLSAIEEHVRRTNVLDTLVSAAVKHLAQDVLQDIFSEITAAKGFVPQVVQPGIMDAMIRRLAGFDLHETVILPENGEKLVGLAAQPWRGAQAASPQAKGAAERPWLMRRRRSAGLRQSMSATGYCYDNAFAESAFASLKAEMLAEGQTFTSRREARTAIFECFYKRRRLRLALDYRSPDGFLNHYFHSLHSPLN